MSRQWHGYRLLSISTWVDGWCHTELMPSTLLPVTSTAGACCAPLVRSALSAKDAATLAATLKAIADPARLRLLSLVAAHEGGEACVCELIEPHGLPPPQGARRRRAAHPRKARRVGLLPPRPRITRLPRRRPEHQLSRTR